LVLGDYHNGRKGKKKKKAPGERKNIPGGMAEGDNRLIHKDRPTWGILNRKRRVPASMGKLDVKRIYLRDSPVPGDEGIVRGVGRLGDPRPR